MSFSVTSTMSPRLAGIMASAAYFAVMMRDVSPCRKIASALFRSACQRKPYNNEMSPRRRKAEDVDVFAALVREHIDILCLAAPWTHLRSEEHTSELQSPVHLVCRLLLEKKKK